MWVLHALYCIFPMYTVWDYMIYTYNTDSLLSLQSLSLLQRLQITPLVSFSIMIPTEKAVFRIRNIFVFYVYTFCLCFDCIRLY